MTVSDPVNSVLGYLITDGGLTNENFRKRSSQTLLIIKRAVDAGISLIQIREKGISARMLFEVSSAAAKIVHCSDTKLLINDRADVAAASGADGVHLAETSLPARVIRSQFPREFIVGVSAHSIDGIKRANADGADFVLFGPVFATPGKGEAQGLEKLADAVKAVRGFPVLAIGGIDDNNYGQVIECGAEGFAAIRFLNNAETLKRLSGCFRAWKK